MPIIEPARVELLPEIDQLIEQCKAALLQVGLYQWDENYPGHDFFEASICEGCAYVMTDDGEVIGVVVLDEWQSPEWGDIPWLNPAGPALVIHALAIHPDYQGRGYGSLLLGFCEDWACENGYNQVRLDVFSENESALNFYEKHGYEYRGEVNFVSKPPGHQQYACYQKIFPN